MRNHYIRADWQVPDSVNALITTRNGGVSAAPFDSFNLAYHVGDNSDSVLQNRERLKSELGLLFEPQWLKQEHGTAVVRAVAGGPVLCADAVFTDKPGLPCAIMTADCLPVFFCNLSGTQVAAAHAGWRGLANGVLEATLDVFCEPPEEVSVWLGPAIGPAHFEVGEEVRTCFVAQHALAEQAFIPSNKAGHWMADIYQLARFRLAACGVTRVTGGGLSTYGEPKRFFSYRRDGLTGRMASLIWLEPQ